MSRKVIPDRSADESSSREALILEHMSLVRYLVGRIAPQLPPHLDRQDLMSCAVVGLINAANRFDKTRGVLFKTFAEQHIRGTIIDELRSYDVLSRTTRDKYKKLERQIIVLEHELGRNPTGEEVAASLGITLDGYYQLLDEVHVISFISLDDSSDDEEGNVLSLADVLSNRDEKNPQQQVMMQQMAKALGDAIEALPEKERLAVTLYYSEDMNLKEIGETLGLTESRISQILSQAMVRLRGKLRLYKG
jgi:RNA polymerase sigma factor for flagellar operon FliA